ncbi:MAG: DUF2868 domain-containing protein [Pseudomonadales bacterium]|nr:DUF2868 domain-containing protein [Pseudomonadales bacterium]
MNRESLTNISRGLSLLVFCLAVISTTAIISGDQYGRVNLLYLLLLFVVWPMASLSLTFLLSITQSSANFVSSLLALPIWPRAWVDVLSQLKRDDLQRPWLFCQGQKMALVFSIGCILAFMFMLLFNDVTFIWRSTILTAEHIFPVLQLIAAPWLMLESAQPLLGLVEASRDSRLQLNEQLSSASSWWRYLFMAQLVYALLPRLLLYVWGVKKLGVAASMVVAKEAESERELQQLHDLQQQQQSTTQFSQPQFARTLADSFVILSWTRLPEPLLDKLTQVLGIPEHIYQLAGSCDLQMELLAQRDTRAKVIIVAAWEPPMGELQDFMSQCQGVLLPLDWNSKHFVVLNELHLDEWQRFCQSQQNWQLQQLQEQI